MRDSRDKTPHRRLNINCDALRTRWKKLCRPPVTDDLLYHTYDLWPENSLFLSRQKVGTRILCMGWGHKGISLLMTQDPRTGVFTYEQSMPLSHSYPANGWGSHVIRAEPQRATGEKAHGHCVPCRQGPCPLQISYQHTAPSLWQLPKYRELH